jgi:hypothetical protein
MDQQQQPLPRQQQQQPQKGSSATKRELRRWLVICFLFGITLLPLQGFIKFKKEQHCSEWRKLHIDEACRIVHPCKIWALGGYNTLELRCDFFFFYVGDLLSVDPHEAGNETTTTPSSMLPDEAATQIHNITENVSVAKGRSQWELLKLTMPPKGPYQMGSIKRCHIQLETKHINILGCPREKYKEMSLAMYILFPLLTAFFLCCGYCLIMRHARKRAVSARRWSRLTKIATQERRGLNPNGNATILRDKEGDDDDDDDDDDEVESDEILILEKRQQAPHTVVTKTKEQHEMLPLNDNNINK